MFKEGNKIVLITNLNNYVYLNKSETQVKINHINEIYLTVNWLQQNTFRPLTVYQNVNTNTTPS
jgi:hypothetical protein